MTEPTRHYSTHFSKEEMVFSEAAARRNLRNLPTPTSEENLIRLCSDFLETVRAEFGPLLITSGYRTFAVNSIIGGSKTSAHMEGRAADFRPLEPVPLVEVVQWIQASHLFFDQVIFEFGRWVHLGIARQGDTPRHQALMIFAPGRYLAFNEAAFPQATT